MTSSPAAKPVTPGPVPATTPARSLPCPDGNVAGHLECSRPSRILASPGLIPAALTWTSTWPGPGTGVGTSTTFRTSTSPYSSNRTAFTSLPPFSQDPSTSRTVPGMPAWHRMNYPRSRSMISAAGRSAARAYRAPTPSNVSATG